MTGSSLRVVFLGNDPWSVPALRSLAGSSHEIVLVVTNEPRPAGRGSRLTPTAVAVAARVDGLPLLETPRVTAGAGRRSLDAAAPDVLVVVAYGELLTADVLGLAPLGAVNVHFSLLPALRGAAPVQGALLGGLEFTGVTTMLMDEGLDTGPVLLRATEAITPEDDAGSLGARLAERGADLLVRTLDLLATGRASPAPQDESDASWAPKLTAADRVIDWSRSAAQVVGLIRALAPAPGAITSFHGRDLKVLRAEVVPAAGEPGHIVEVSNAGPVVATGDGGVRPSLVAPAGRKRMSGGDFVHGMHPRPGDILG